MKNLVYELIAIDRILIFILLPCDISAKFLGLKIVNLLKQFIITG